MDTNKIPVYVASNMLHHFLLPGFATLFNHFWSTDKSVIVMSYGKPDIHIKKLTNNFSFYSIAPDNYPASQWSTGIYHLFEHAQKRGQKWILLMLRITGYVTEYY